MPSPLACPHCGAALLHVSRSPTPRIKLRTRCVAFTAAGAETACRECGRDVRLDMAAIQRLVQGIAQSAPLIVGLDTPDRAR